jgi:aminoglycoside phosphotransferase (APT) family kinase protein
MASDLTPVRSEDSFDIDALHHWLKEQLPDLPLAPEVYQFRSGASNLTYLLRYSDRELVLRRPPHGRKAASAHDMGREVRVQRGLRPHLAITPEVLAFTEDVSIIGSPFYVMSKLSGTILRRDRPEDVVLTPAINEEIGRVIIDAFARLHAVDVNAAGLNELGKGPGYVGRQVAGWSMRYRAARGDDVPDGERVMGWLDAHQPADIGQQLLHGDWRLDNIVLDLTDAPRLVGVLDWELATVGDPLMDLGSALAYWITAADEPGFASLRRQPSHLPGMPTREEFVERYLALSGYPCDDFTFYEVFGIFRLAVICQQIWARFRSGETTNPDFEGFGQAVHILINRAESLIT